MELVSVGTPALWIGFTTFVLEMLLAGIYKIPILVSLGVIVALLAGSIIASLLRPPATPLAPAPHPDQPAEVKP